MSAVTGRSSGLGLNSIVNNCEKLDSKLGDAGWARDFALNRGKFLKACCRTAKKLNEEWGQKPAQTAFNSFESSF